MKLLKILALTLLIIGTGCTEDRVEQTLLKPEDQIFSKDKISEESLYLYTPLNLESSRTSLYGRAYQVGQAKVVKVKIREFSMDIESIEKDDRFGNNPNNNKVLLSVPITHVDYRCQDDAYGECLGQEVENDRIPWNQKKFMKLDFAKSTITDTNFFASEFAGPNSCYNEENVEVTARAIDNESIHFNLKRDYKDQLFFFCIRNHDLTDFTNLNWTETTSYSLVKLDSVASPDYSKVVYHPDWINTFGFFEVDDNQLDVDGNAAQTGEQKYMQLWNPNRTEIVYHLSESFNKPENQVLKAATYESVGRINNGLAQAGVKFKIRLAEPDPSVNPGDLRNSMLVLVDDPVASGVIGYGPSTANPLTGEVISARTIMYSGAIRKFVRFTYDDIVRTVSEAAALASQPEQPGVQQTLGLSDQLQKTLLDSSLISEIDTTQMLDLSQISKPAPVSMVDRTPEISHSELEHFMDTESKKDFIAEMAKQNKYPAQALSFGDINQDLVKQMIAEVGQLKPWEQLADVEKQKVLDVLTPYVWVPTLVHEIGHNLGLRHNFSGSEDADNFYSDEELTNLGVPVSSTNVPYSSIMDYSKSEVNALRTLGKYDIAALRFGYTKTVEMADGQSLAVNPSVAAVEGLKSYQYCSDEGVAPNPTCNPFDEGVNMLEITQSIIDSYKERYSRSNFRRGRANFSGIGDDFYLRRLSRTFNTLRLVYERYETLVRDFDLDQATIDEVEFLREIDEAVVLAADFMMEVIATPDTTCVVQDVMTGQLQVVPIGIFSELAHNQTRQCADLQLNEQFVVVGQAGKALNSLKLPSNPNRFADQIDIRGIWMDKALAMQTLFRRTLGSSLHDKHNGNFLDHPKVAPKLIQFIADLTSNNLLGPLDVTFVDGSSTRVEFPVSLADNFYEVTAPELPLPNMMLGLPYDNMHLPEILVRLLKNSVDQGSDSQTKALLQQAITVHDTHPAPGSNEYLETSANGQRIFVHQSSFLAADMVRQANRASFYESTQLSIEELGALLEKMQAKPPAPIEQPGEGEKQPPVDELTPVEQAIIARGPAELEAYLINPTESTYMKRILLAL